MAGTKKPNLWYVVILGAAGAGLAFDSFVLRAKADSEPTTEDAAIEAAATLSSTAAVKAAKNEPLGARFDAASALLESPAFRRLDGFVKASDDALIASPENSGTSGGFASRHKLTAVLSQPSGDLAVVDGLLLRVGDSVEGVKLTAIEKDGAIFEVEGKQIRLPLARPGFDR